MEVKFEPFFAKEKAAYVEEAQIRSADGNSMMRSTRSGCCNKKGGSTQSRLNLTNHHYKEPNSGNLPSVFLVTMG